jgi:hypothetical protein
MSRAAAALFGAVVVAGAIALVLRAGARRTAQPARVERTSVEIVSDPPGATVVRADDGGVLGVTPAVVVLPKQNGVLPVIVRLDGYEPRNVDVPLFSSSGRVDVKLTAAAHDAAASRD